MTDSRFSLIQEALRGKHVLITGTTGFVGKVLLEKIIRDIPDIGGIHLLIRAGAKYQDAFERFQSEIYSSSVFDRMRSENPDFLDQFVRERLFCVSGEMTEPFFGLSETEFARLSREVDVVVNSAASVNFREELDKALQINTLSLNNVIDFSTVAGDIPVIQVSTCYVNGLNRDEIAEENIAPAGEAIPQSEEGYFEVQSLIDELHLEIDDISSRISDEAALRDELIDLGIRQAHRFGWNDTYTFTKWLGEQLLLKELKGRSLTILRPSIIESALQSPVPGWIEGVKVADAIILAYAREKVSLFPGRDAGVIDVIPADLVANSIILSVAEVFTAPVLHRIYQCCSGGSNPIRLRDFIHHLQAESRENYQAYERLFYRQPKKPFITINKALFLFLMRVVRSGVFISYKASQLLGNKKKPRLLENTETALNLSLVFSFYTAPNYLFDNSRLMALASRMDAKDRELFPVDARLIDWKQYLRKIHLSGLNKYALKPRRGEKNLSGDEEVSASRQAA